MSHLRFPDAECAGKRRKTRREVFLEEREQVIRRRSPGPNVGAPVFEPTRHASSVDAGGSRGA